MTHDEIAQKMDEVSQLIQELHLTGEDYETKSIKYIRYQELKKEFVRLNKLTPTT